MSRERNIWHWQNVLEPLKEHLKDYIGTTFTYIFTDSYEAGDQDWTPLFRDEFIRLKGYDPLPRIALRQLSQKYEGMEVFEKDNKEVISRLFIDNGWAVAKEMINDAGLQFFWEPYIGPFDLFESVSVPDMPMGEFWVDWDGAIVHEVAQAAALQGKNIVGAEAFSGRPEVCMYTEDPAYLKHTADVGFVFGANFLFITSWPHNPFDDRYQPGLTMGWWGAHFGRNQTWIKPAKAFFTYITRCQMLLQYGKYVSSGPMVHRSAPDAEIFFVTNPSDTVRDGFVSFPVSNRVPELWKADRGTIHEPIAWRDQGDSTFVKLSLNPDESVFVVFPRERETGYAALKLPAVEVIGETSREVGGSWDVLFEPKLDEPFRLELPALIDFSQHADTAIKYFAGKAVYERTITASAESLGKNGRVILDLGQMHDIAELSVNGQEAGVLWYPPYRADITSLLKPGDNTITIAVTNNWANRLIGDEQYPADFEWGQDRGRSMGRAMKAFPDWFLQDRPRPSKRKTFNIWYYYRKDAPLQPAGLVGPVQIIEQQIE